MKHTKLISGVIAIILGVIIAFFIPAPAGLSHAGMVVLASLVTANLFGSSTSSQVSSPGC